MRLGLLSSGNDKRYYLTDKNTCDRCEEQLDYIALVFFSWKSWDSCEQSILCQRCMKHKPGSIPGRRENYFTAYVIDAELLPEGVVPFIPKAPDYVPGHIASFDFAERVIDKTRVAGRPGSSWEGATIGANMTLLIDEKDSTVEDVDKFLLELTESDSPLLLGDEHSEDADTTHPVPISGVLRDSVSR